MIFGKGGNSRNRSSEYFPLTPAVSVRPRHAKTECAVTGLPSVAGSDDPVLEKGLPVKMKLQNCLEQVSETFDQENLSVRPGTSRDRTGTVL